MEVEIVEAGKKERVRRRKNKRSKKRLSDEVQSMYIPKKQVVYQILCLFRLSLTSSSSSPSSFFLFFSIEVI